MRRLVLIPLLLAVACGGDAGELRFDEAVPADLRELASGTWDEFTAAFEARRGCIAPLTLAGDRDLGAQAAYVPDRRTVYVRIPGTAGLLRNALIHEFAHHVEFTCHDDLAGLRPAFLAAQGFPPDAGWFDAASWEVTPSEHFAEAAVEAVLGRRLRNRDVLITDEAVALVTGWGAGD